MWSLNSNLKKFKRNSKEIQKFLQYREDERTISIDFFQKRLNQNIILIDKFQILQDYIESLVMNTADEEEYHQVSVKLTKLCILTLLPRSVVTYNVHRRCQRCSTFRFTNALSIFETLSLFWLFSIPVPSFHDELDKWIFFYNFER